MSTSFGADRDVVLQATDLVRLVGEHVSLRPKGREFAGLCPFHDDKNPSMMVSPQKQIFKCFVCGAGGTCFDFVMKYHKLDFPEALQMLADRAGIELQKKGRGDGKGPSQRKRLAEINSRALAFFRAMLIDEKIGAEARAYLERRGVNPEVVEQFELGYAPDGWDALATAAGKERWPIKDLELAGLIKQRSNGTHYDALRHRLVFPISDALGRPIAFGGRKLREEDEPKYLNSPETPLFDKSSTLYGLSLAKKTIIDRHTAVIVEGYTDVIACHQHGATNVVAALGTALTAQHASELRRYCERVVLVMDGDAAGQKAADRAVELFLTADIDVAIAILPGGQDPDELLRAEGLEAWNRAVNGATDALDFVFRSAQEQLGNAGGVTGQQQVAEQFLTRLANLGFARAGDLRRNLIVQRLSGLLKMSPQSVAEQLAKRPVRSTGPARPQSPAPRPNSQQSAGTASDDERWGGVDDQYAASVNLDEEADFEPGQADQPVTSPGVQPDSRVPRAVAVAERQILGTILRFPELIQIDLEGAGAFDEAIDPSRFVTPLHREAYQAVYDALLESPDLTLADLLAALTEAGRMATRETLVAVEQEAEDAAEQRDVAERMLRGAAARLLRHHQQQGGSPQSNSPDDPLAKLQQLRDAPPDHALPAKALGRTL